MRSTAGGSRTTFSTYPNHTFHDVDFLEMHLLVRWSHQLGLRALSNYRKNQGTSKEIEGNRSAMWTDTLPKLGLPGFDIKFKDVLSDKQHAFPSALWGRHEHVKCPH
jgi:hypothetical protein